MSFRSRVRRSSGERRAHAVRSALVAPGERIARSIVVLRGRKVLLDADLAALYGVRTKALLQAAKRNPDRFPQDFMFRLTIREFNRL
ncbi:MAG: ORF6N domain-containing protein, partial [Candidatus Rokuibacteriota bacterium]